MLRDLVVEGPTSLGGRARSRRWQLFARLFPDIADYDVLDLGGTPSSWLRASVQPRSVTVLNFHQGEFDLTDGLGVLPSWMRVVHGDACHPPEEVRDRRFDLVFSNSLIEHVGGSFRRAQLAEVVRHSGDRYWLQTPYRYFPVEPHWIFPGFQFLPLNVQAGLSQRWPMMHTRATSHGEGVEAALDVDLMSITELRHVFPDAEIYLEKFLGLPKSLIAART